MNEAKKLTLQMALFFLIVFVAFSYIIIKEKSNELFLPKIQNSFNNYVEENYNNLELQQGKININNNTYTMKVMNTENSNLYFYITYSNKEITDTYQEDYIEGKSLISHLNKVIEENITQKTQKNYKVKINNTFNNFSDKVQERLIKENNIESLKIYTLEINLSLPWETQSITKTITDIMTNLKKDKITPKNYTITITDQNDITKSVKIINLVETNLENNNLSLIIDDIINNRNTSILYENKINYEYLNIGG